MKYDPQILFDGCRDPQNWLSVRLIRESMYLEGNKHRYDVVVQYVCVLDFLDVFASELKGASHTGLDSHTP